MENFLILAETEINAAVVLLTLLFVVALELVISYVYYKIHMALSYSRATLFSFILVGVVVSLIMMVISENIFGAFAFFIVFSLIRFRSIVKEPLDAVFLLLSLVIGASAGLGGYTIAGISAALFSLIMLVLWNRGFLTRGTDGYIIRIVMKNPLPKNYTLQWKEHIVRHHVISTRELPDGQSETILSVVLVTHTAAATLARLLTEDTHINTFEITNKYSSIAY